MAKGDFVLTVGTCDSTGDGREFKIAATSSGAADTLHTATSTAGTWDLITIEALVVDAPGADPTLTILYPDVSGGSVECTVTLDEDGGPRVVREKLRLRGGGVIKAYTSHANKVSCRVDVDRYEES